jgi:hypothetical protein
VFHLRTRLDGFRLRSPSIVLQGAIPEAPGQRMAIRVRYDGSRYRLETMDANSIFRRGSPGQCQLGLEPGSAVRIWLWPRRPLAHHAVAGWALVAAWALGCPLATRHHTRMVGIFCRHAAHRPRGNSVSVWSGDRGRHGVGGRNGRRDGRLGTGSGQQSARPRNR